LLKGENKMTTYVTLDLPTLHRSFVGFEQLFEEINRSFQMSKQDNYPPHNIIRTGDNRYIIEMAVAGFLENELDIETVTNNYGQNVLTIRGHRQREDDADWQYLHRGLATRNFERSFPLSENVEIVGATVTNGILTVTLEHKVPETQKPKKVAITYSK
jgi:molecular chaperone IbpA